MINPPPPQAPPSLPYPTLQQTQLVVVQWKIGIRQDFWSVLLERKRKIFCPSKRDKIPWKTSSSRPHKCWTGTQNISPERDEIQSKANHQILKIKKGGWGVEKLVGKRDTLEATINKQLLQLCTLLGMTGEQMPKWSTKKLTAALKHDLDYKRSKYSSNSHSNA